MYVSSLTPLPPPTTPPPHPTPHTPYNATSPLTTRFCDENDDGEVDCRECMRASAKIVLLIINAIWIILGLGMCIGGAYAAISLESLSELFDMTAIIIVSIIGAFLFLVGLLGCFSVFNLQCKSLGFVYGLLLLALAIGMAGAGGALASYAGVIGDTGQSTADDLAKESRERIDDYILCMHARCCPNATAVVTPSASSVSDSPAPSVEASQECTNPASVQGGVCAALDQVLGTDPDKCEGTRDDFKENVQAFITSQVTTLMISVFSVAGVQFIGFVIACSFVLTTYTGGENSASVTYEA